MAAPIADAGSNQTVNINQANVLLDASASYDPDAAGPLTYVWQMNPVGAVTLSDVTAVNPTFTAPAAAQSIAFRVIVEDADSETSDPSPWVTVTVQTPNTAPIADPGPNLNNETVGVAVPLDGSASSDADGDTLSYVWQLPTVPAGSLLTDADIVNATSVNASFTPDMAGVYVARLTVNDGTESSLPVNLFITANAANNPPIANAGGNLNDETVGQSVTLNGSGSSDPDGDTITFLWQITTTPGGSVITSDDIVDSTAETTTFIPDVAGIYAARLIVNDGIEASEPANVFITASDENNAPTAKAGPDQTVEWGQDVTLDGTASSDIEDGNNLIYNWLQLNTDTAPTITFNDDESSTPQFTAPSEDCVIEIGLIVRDQENLAAIDPDLVVITVQEANVIPSANAGVDQTVEAGQLVTLTGSSSYDADGDALTYSWNQEAGTSVDLPDFNSENPTFTAPSLPTQDVLTFSLKVSDGVSTSTADTVNITVNALVGSDTVPPVITMNGPNNYKIPVGFNYVDQGATAYDDYSGVTAVTATGLVNTAVSGIYTITYDAIDAAGNAAVPVTRIVEVVDASEFKEHSKGNFHSSGPIFTGATEPSDPLLAQTYVDGELVRIEWDQVNPSRGVFDFSAVRMMVDLATSLGKSVNLGVLDALTTPQWVLDSCETFAFELRPDDPDSETSYACLPWDEHYQTIKSELVEALGVEFDGDPSVTCVYFTYSAMTNGIEFHWRVDETEYAAVGYTQEVFLNSAKTILDMYIEHFPTTPIAIEGHTVFNSQYQFESLYDYGFSVIGSRLGIGLWWLASRIVENTSGNDHETVIWPIAQRARAQGSFVIGQTIGNFTEQPDRFDSGDGWTTTEAFLHEREFFFDEIDCWEFWTIDLQNQVIIDLLSFDFSTPYNVGIFISPVDFSQDRLLFDYVKDPSDIENFTIDASRWLKGHSIDSYNIDIPTDSNLTLQTVDIVGDTVQAMISGGTEGAHSLDVTISASDGRVRQRKIRMRVRDQ